MLTVYVLSVPLLLKIVKSSNIVWDYVVTTSFVHWILTCAVSQTFPTNWAWWLTFLLLTLGLVVFSELVNYFCYDLRRAAKIADANNHS